jgi:hypothetical protein
MPDENHRNDRRAGVNGAEHSLQVRQIVNVPNASVRC